MHLNATSIATIALLGLAVAANPSRAQDGTDTLGGRPPAGAVSSIKDFNYQIRYQRAFEAVLWSLPLIQLHGLRRAAFQDLGAKDNDILAYSGTATPKLEAITANSTTPYIASYTDLRKGPAVLEIPPAGADGSIYGQVVDAWQLTIADVGPSGLDKGKGGKLLFTPPGYSGEVPAGYTQVASPNYQIAFAFRSVPAPGKGPVDAYAYSRKLRMYYLSQSGSPPEQRFIDPLHDRYATLPYYDERYFEELHHVIDVEPVNAQDKVMMGMLASLGIEKGKPFAPDAVTRKAMRQGAIDAWFYLQEWFDNIPKDKLFWPDRHYASLLMADPNRTFTFVDDNHMDLIGRAAEYFWCTYMPRVLADNPATQYLMAMADNKGQPLEPGRLYKIDIPAAMPVKQFWALTVYDRATMSFIYTNSGRTTLSSYDLDRLTKNNDGGVTIYIGPNAPKGQQSNWIPTAGRRPLPAIRFYGPTEALNTKEFKMPDFELVE